MGYCWDLRRYGQTPPKYPLPPPPPPLKTRKLQLFKQVAINYNRLGVLLDWRVIGVLAIAGVLYVTSTGLWVWALRSVELSKAYPLFALGFVLVPIASAFLFGEALTLKFGVGVALIVAGVVLTSG